MSENYIEIDYPGWEQVDFNTMSWRFVQGNIETDERALKRVGATVWLITDDYGNWVDYASTYPVEDRSEVVECIELYYQDHIKGKR